ncbi:DUF1800 domain-containing protein [Solitalea sp. MAHUQ-68]|uniref:DUF1800 domain-containing protein n=1 Tax=Solitalea agri TaxID=2953739 RepID=A0A9X2F543_9SPHI|nr:DUF1800 domain-containing protein [Solitalea agri]MCO4294349.1 DUF1800 domain-containing protein [Solitalea agri]
MERLSMRQIQHLYARAGFGITYKDLQQLKNKPLLTVVKELFEKSNDYSLIDLDFSLEEVKGKEMMSEENRKELRRLFKQSTENLNTRWMQQMSVTDAQLREKMTLFWHGHFACRSFNPLHNQQLNNTMRNLALGNFKDLLLAVSKSPAMLAFLNNQQNRKNSPNENFARELMELFTIGRGNYTENDVKESARAFTGWGFTPFTTEFVFRTKQHDFGDKTFMGHTGNFNGEDIIDIILKQKETARFICRKFYKFFVNENINETHVNQLADHFYQTNYNIGSTMFLIFSSDWFYSSENIGVNIKSPVEFIVGLTRQFYVSYESTDMLLFLQRALGQILFYPPNVSGWPGGKNWIDSSTLMYRLKIPSVILNNGIIELAGKTDPEEEAQVAMMQKQESQIHRKIKATADWDHFLQDLPQSISREQLVDYFLAPDLNKRKYALLSALSESTVKEIIIQLVSMPEYQLC